MSAYVDTKPRRAARLELARAHWDAKYPETAFQRALREKRERTAARRRDAMTSERKAAMTVAWREVNGQ